MAIAGARSASRPTSSTLPCEALNDAITWKLLKSRRGGREALTWTIRTSPAIILVSSQMGENVMRRGGRCSIAGSPICAWSIPGRLAECEGQRAAVGAFEMMPPVRVFDTATEALAGSHLCLPVTTARDRDMVKPVVLRAMRRQRRGAYRRRRQVSFMFGAERMGLLNDDVSLANA